MGLCKCPKRKVTQHFCFEHRVNVCEFCMTQDHVKCVVEPYFKWLEDSSYSPNCRFCSESLADEICIRLLCYHIFHWRCFNRYAQDHPADTTPSGFACPDCNTSVFPALGSTSPVALQLQNLLANADWAKQGLGESLIDQRTVSFSSLPDATDDETNNAVKVVKNSIMNNSSYPTSIPVNVNPVSSFMESSEWTTRTTHGIHQQNQQNQQQQQQQQQFNNSEDSLHESRLCLLTDDVDEDKYKSKSASEFLFRWFRNRRSLMSQQQLLRSSAAAAVGHCNAHSSFPIRRYLFPAIIAIVVLFTLIHFFFKYGRQSAEADLSLDPAFNPYIRKQD